MSVKLITLDRRHNGYGMWKYCVERPFNVSSQVSKEIFYTWRVWCWETWGPSKELNEFDYRDLFDGEMCSNNHWCWLNDEHRRSRIYLKSDSDASIFALQFL